MIYLNKDDLITDSFEKFIDESSNDNTGILDKQEYRAVNIVKNYIGTRYDINKIFDINTPIKDAVLISIISRIVLYSIIRRNAARKVPTDYKEDFDDAMKELEKISTGKIKLNNLPAAVDEQGNTISNTIWGNNSNKDFYI